MFVLICIRFMLCVFSAMFFWLQSHSVCFGLFQFQTKPNNFHHFGKQVKMKEAFYAACLHV